MVIGVSCNIAALLGILLRPFMPTFAEEIFAQCKLPSEHRSLAPMVTNGGHIICLLPEGHVIGEVGFCCSICIVLLISSPEGVVRCTSREAVLA